jgi:three-Cys-motif partner protein
LVLQKRRDYQDCLLRSLGAFLAKSQRLGPNAVAIPDSDEFKHLFQSISDSATKTVFRAKWLDKSGRQGYSAKESGDSDFDIVMQNNTSAIDGLPVRKSGEWAKRKHHFLKNYCGITTVSMRNKFKNGVVYLDVMAGPGKCKIEETNEEFPGSPMVALDHDFAKYIFIEEEPALANALKQRVANHPKASKIKIIPENWISVVRSGRLKFDVATLVVAFVDPTGISQVPLSAMKMLAHNPKIDLLITIQYRLGIVWNAPQYRKSKSGQTALDNFLDDQSWREWESQEPGEFGRLAVEHFCDKFQREEGFIGTRHLSIPENNPLYRFTLFSRHPLGESFWLKILKTDEKGQRELL